MKKKSTQLPARPFLHGGPRFSLPVRDRAGAFPFYAAVTGLGALGAFACLLTAFEFPLNVPLLVTLGAALTLLCVGLELVRLRWKWAVTLGLWAGWGLLLWRLFPLVSQGAVRAWNLMAAAWSQRLNYVLPPLALPVGAVTDRQASVTAFFAFWLLPVIFLLARMLTAWGGVLGPFALTGLVVLLPLGFSILPARWAIGVMLLFWTFLLLAAPSLKRREGPDRWGRVHTQGRRFARVSSLLLIPLLALTLWGIYRLWPPETYTRPAIAAQLLEGANRLVNFPALFRGGTGSGGDSVDLTALGSREFNGSTVLQVRHEWQGPAMTPADSPTFKKDYLKSFAGTVYTGSSWERPDPETAREMEALAGRGLRGQTLLWRLEETLPLADGEWSRYRVTVRRKNTDPRSVYAPTALALEDLPDGMAWREDGSVTAGWWLAGPGEVTLPGLALPREGAWLFTRLYHRLDSLRAADDSFPSPWAGLNQALYEDLMEHTAVGGTASSMDLWQVPAPLLEQLPEEWRPLVEQSQEYADLVYRTDTQLPQDTRAFCREYLSAHGLSPDLPATDRWEVIARIREILAAECVYSLSPPSISPGEDFVTAFLGRTRQGYCVHFATAAAALLRASGIPARYAEGYAVPVRSAPGDSFSDWVDVPDYNAHAWVEVYAGGSGWLPVEVTPAGPDAPAAYANASAPSAGEVLLPTPTPRPTPRPRDQRHPEAQLTPPPMPTATPLPTPVPDPVAENAAKTRSAVFGLVLGLLAAASPFLMLALVRRVRLSLRAARFRQPDRNKAALAVYAHLLRLYRANFDLPYGGYDPPEEITELALRARYSQHTLTREELGKLTGLAAQLEQRLRENLSPWPRRKWKWLYALF